MVVVQSDTEERLYLDNYTAHTTFISWFHEETYSRIRSGLHNGLCRLKNDTKLVLFKMSPIKYTVLQLFQALYSGDFAYSQLLINIAGKHNRTSHETLVLWLESNFRLAESEMYKAVRNYAHFFGNLNGTQYQYTTNFLVLLSDKYFLLRNSVEQTDLITTKWMLKNSVSNIPPEAVEQIWSNKDIEIMDLIISNSKDKNKTYVSNLFSSLFPDELFIDHVITNGLTHILQSVLEENFFKKCLILSLCLEKNATEVIKLVEKTPYNLSSCSASSSVKLLHSSVLAGRTDISQRVLDLGTSIDSVDADGNNLLYKALISNRSAAVKFLFKSGADCNSKIQNGKTILSVCICLKHIECTEVLLNMGANTHLPDNNGLTPLDYLLLNNDIELLKFVVNRWLKIEQIVLRGSPLLHHAVLNGSCQVTRALLELGSNPNALSQNGDSPLILATKLNDTIKILYLIEYGAEINMKDANGNIPLHIAVEWSTFSVVKVLTILGANFSSVNSRGQSPLYIAVRENRHLVIPFLISKGANMEEIIENGGTLLHLAALSDSVDAFEILLDRNMSIDAKTNSNETSLVLAVRSNKPRIVRLIASKGGNINEVTKDGDNLLHVAVDHGSIETMILLLRFGLYQDALNLNGKSPLANAIAKNDFLLLSELLNNTLSFNFDINNIILAVLNGWINSLKALKSYWDKYGVDFHKEDKRSGLSPLTVAVGADKPKSVKYLKEVGADMRFRTRSNDTLVHIASEGGSIRVLKLLVEWGLEVDDLNVLGETPLWLATKGAHLAVMKFLKKCGADMKIRAKMEPWENGCLLHPAAYSGSPESVSWLLSNNLNVNDADEIGVTPLQVASELGKLDAAVVLLDEGAAVDSADVGGLTSLHKAVFFDHTEVARLLVTYGAELDLMTVTRSTPLHQAASRGNDEIVNMIVKCGAERDLLDHNGWTPFHWASYKGHVAVVESLIRLGFNTTLKDKNGFTPLNLANEKKHQEIVNLINVSY